MWRNYLIVGIRALAKSRTYAFINIFGLAIGLAACLILLVFVRYELTFDRDLPGADRAYQLQTYYTDPDTGEEGNLQMAAYVTKQALLKDFPQIEQIAYLQWTKPVVILDGEPFEVDDFKLTDGNIFDILQFPFVKGSADSALDKPGSIVLTQSEAKRRFGDEDAMGRTLTVVLNGRNVDHRVTGIVADPPRNSHVRFTMVARYDPQSFWADTPDFLTQWGWQSGHMYLKLKPGADAAAINAQLQAFEKRNIPDQNFGGQRTNQGDQQDYGLVNIADVHLGKAQDGSMTPGNDRRSILTFGIVALLILGMACVNFTNLATARASARAREVALRKVLGARRSQLITQFLVESMLVAALAMLIGLALAELALPWIGRALEADLTLRYFGREGLILPIILLTLGVGAAGGLYPAFYLSRFQPAQVLKANKSTAEAQGTGRLRSILVVSQFAVSIGLIICTAVVYAQTVYARTADPGYKREGLIQIGGISRRQLEPVMETITREIERVPGVEAVGRTTIGIATTNSSNNGVMLPGRTDPINIGNYNIDEGFLPAMGINFLAGRNFDPARPADNATTPTPEDPAAEQAFAARGANVIVNELAAKRMGFANPADALGKQVKATIVGEEYGGVAPITIIGVVKDSRFRSIREPIDSIIYYYRPTLTNNLLVRYNDPDPAAVAARIEKLWKRLAPEVPFDAEFSDDIIGELYEAEDARAQTFAAFAVLAVIVACLGLFGLAAFTAERRTKEIGIRKVLGARTADIVKLLAWQFSQPVIIANLIAWPVAWWVMRDWLNGFDARIALGPTPFVLAGAVALAIAIGTIAGHAFRVARSNPIQALRYE